eukprot:6460248-Amphidinium_carterae.1
MCDCIATRKTHFNVLHKWARHLRPFLARHPLLSDSSSGVLTVPVADSETEDMLVSPAPVADVPSLLPMTSACVANTRRTGLLCGWEKLTMQ